MLNIVMKLNRKNGHQKDVGILEPYLESTVISSYAIHANKTFALIHNTLFNAVHLQTVVPFMLAQLTRLYKYPNSLRRFTYTHIFIFPFISLRCEFGSVLHMVEKIFS